MLTLALVLAAGCNSFENPNIVVDLRILGARTEPPEILVPADPELIDPTQLPEVEVCILVADPGDSRELSYAMTACSRNSRGRCDARAQPQVDLGSGTVGDPEEGADAVRICETLGASPALAEVIEGSYSIDNLQGFGAIDIQIGIAVWPAGNNLAQAQYATKALRFGAALPEERKANTNPALENVTVSSQIDGQADFELPVGRCGDIEAIGVKSGETLGLLPVEVVGAREDYLVPTFDGGSRSFTENISYRFYATHGGFTKGSTGGPRDVVGNVPTLDTEWTAPSDSDVVGEGIEVSLFIVWRDERGGQSWLQSCVRVAP